VPTRRSPRRCLRWRLGYTVPPAPLYLRVAGALDQLGVATLGSPTTAILLALYVTGLVLLDARPTQTRVTRLLLGRCHDALNRLLRTTPWSTRALTGLLVAWVMRMEPAATCAWPAWWSRRCSPGGCRGPGGPTRSPTVLAYPLIADGLFLSSYAILLDGPGE
jgi:hypothetical protein